MTKYIALDYALFAWCLRYFYTCYHATGYDAIGQALAVPSSIQVLRWARAFRTGRFVTNWLTLDMYDKTTY